MSLTLSHDDKLEVVFVKNNETGEIDDTYVYGFLDTVRFQVPGYKTIPNLYAAAEYYEFAVKGEDNEQARN